MGFIVVIPARFASSRLPGKPLLPIAGKTMIEHVWARACQSQADRVVIATDDARIEAAANAFGAEVCMTKQSHQSGTDRLQEVAEMLGLVDEQVIINVQGDEPLIPPEVINQLALMMQASETQMATLYEYIHEAKQLFDANTVKLVEDLHGQALYFSRAPIPWDRDALANGATLSTLTPERYKRHIGIYGYRAKLLHQFVQWPMSDLESIEKLEQLRAMSHGIRIRVAQACTSIPAGIDTQEDLDAVRALFA